MKEALKQAGAYLLAATCAIAVALATLLAILAHKCRVGADSLMGSEYEYAEDIGEFNQSLGEVMRSAVGISTPIAKEDDGVEPVIGGNENIDS